MHLSNQFLKPVSEQHAINDSSRNQSGSTPDNGQDEVRRSLLGDLVHKTVGLVVSGESQTRTNAENMFTQFATSVPLFMGGPAGYIGSGLLYALNGAKTSDSAGEMLGDLALGGVKGVATRGTFEFFGGANMSFAMKGVAMGSSSRVLDVGLSRETYTDDKGKFSLAAGLSLMGTTAFSSRAMLVDMAAGSVAGAGFRSIAGVGFATGATSGALSEMQNQLDRGEGLNLGKVLTSAGEQGTVMGLSAMAGHKLTPVGTPDVIRTPSPEKDSSRGLSDAIGERLSGIKSMLATPDHLVPVAATVGGVRMEPLAVRMEPAQPAAGLRMENRAQQELSGSGESYATEHDTQSEFVEEPKIHVDPVQLAAAKKWYADFAAEYHNTYDAKKVYPHDALPLADAQHIVTLTRAEAEEATKFSRAFYGSEHAALRAGIDTVSDWAIKDSTPQLTAETYDSLLHGDLHKALEWANKSGYGNKENPLHALEFEHAKMLETLNGFWGFDVEHLARNLNAESTRAGVEASAVVDWLKAHRGEKLTEEQFNNLPFHNMTKLANLMDSLNTENGAARSRPEGTYPLTEQEIELAKFAARLDANGDSFLFNRHGLGATSNELMHALRNRGIEAQRFSEFIMAYTAHRPEVPLTPEKLNEFMQDQRLNDGKLVDRLKLGDPDLIKRPDGDLAVTKEEIDTFTRLAKPQQYFDHDWVKLMEKRGKEAAFLLNEAYRHWSRNDYEPLPEEELVRLGTSDKAKALRLLDDIQLDRNNARALPEGNSPITLDEAKAIAVLDGERGLSSPKMTFFKRSIGAMKMAEQVANHAGRNTEITQEWLDGIANTDFMRMYRMSDALKHDVGDIRQVPPGEFPVTLDEARTLEKAGQDQQRGHVAHAFGYRHPEAERFVELLTGSRENRGWQDPPIEDISAERYRRIGIAAGEFEVNAFDFKTPFMPDRMWSERNSNDVPRYDVHKIFQSSEGLPEEKIVPYFRNWSKLVASSYADEKGTWVKPETLRAMTDILPADANYSGTQLKGLYDHIEQEGSVSSLSPDQLNAAVLAWANQPGLPEKLAVEVGSLSLRERLAGGLAWQRALTDLGVNEGTKLTPEQKAPAEASFRDHMSELGAMKQRDLLRMLTGARSIADAIELQFGNGLSAQDKGTLASSLIKSVTENRDPMMIANNRHAMAVPEPYSIISSLSARSFADALRATEANGGLDARAAVAGALTFKGSFGQWLAMQKGYGRNLHDATYWLPARPAHEQSGLGEALINNGANRLVDLEMAAREWPNIDPAVRERIKKPGKDEAAGKPIDELGNYLQELRSRSYPGFKSADFAAEAAMWGVKPSEYESFEKRFLDSQEVPMPFDTNARFKSGNLTGRFIPRSDARGIFLGQYTNCCQHPYGQASSSAWYGQENPHSGFFVVENPRGDIVAMSWVWQSSKGGVVFDNVEAKGINNREKAVQEIYSSVARALAPKFGTVTLGTKLGDLSTDIWPDTTPLPLPAGYNGYSDAPAQVLLAERQG